VLLIAKPEKLFSVSNFKYAFHLLIMLASGSIMEKKLPPTWKRGVISAIIT